MISVYLLAFLSTALGYTSYSFPPLPRLELRDVDQGTAPLVIDTFQDPLHNDLGFWHGAGEDLTLYHEPGSVSFFPIDPDQNYHTQFNTHGCFSLLPWQDQFLHVIYDGTDQFTVSLNEHNIECSAARAPFPGVPDSVQASRYVVRTRSDSRDDDDSSDSKDAAELYSKSGEKGGQGPASPPKTELYIPLSHFRVDQRRVVSVSFTGFYTNETLTLHRVEIVPSVPPPSRANNYFTVPRKMKTGRLVLRCSVPNSFAFGIDDGQPKFAQEVMSILDEEDVRVTFFVVGAGLQDSTTNFTHFYKEMMKKGHQVALHSNTHPK